MITENMRNFINANISHRIVKGERLTPEFGEIKTGVDMKRSDRVKYTLENDEVFVITLRDKISHDYEPKWSIQ